MKRAFTLIELLVVVLIIGILAAIALPQYQKAVIKARVSTILPVLKAIKNAEEVYYIENGKYTVDINNLGVQLPNNCSEMTGGDGGLYKCGDFFILDLDDQIEDETGKSYGKIIASYCPGQTSSYTNCAADRALGLIFYYEYNAANGISNELICDPANNNQGKTLCKLFGAPVEFGSCSKSKGCTKL